MRISDISLPTHSPRSIYTTSRHIHAHRHTHTPHTPPRLICYYSIYQPGLSRCRCFWKWRTVNSNISAFSSLVCLGWCASPVLPLPFFVDSNINAFSMAKLWLIRARRLFSIKGLFVRLFELSWCIFGDDAVAAVAAGEGSAVEKPSVNTGACCFQIFYVRFICFWANIEKMKKCDNGRINRRNWIG